MSYAPSIIERLQLDMGAIAQAAPYFGNVSVTVNRPRASNTAVMIQDEIDKALLGLVEKNGAAGAAIVVDMPEGEAPHPESPGPDLLLLCKVRVIENPLINMGPTGTLKSAEDLMLAVLNLFQGRFFQDSGSAMTTDREAYVPMLAYIDQGMVGYECRFRMRMGLAGPKKTPMPVISGNAIDGVTIVGAGAIYFSTDGSYPTPTNGTALNPPVLDDAGNPIFDDQGNPIFGEAVPINVAAGTLVRAVAYQNNQQASDLAAKTIS